MFNVATRHVDEWVGHVGREDPWEDVAEIFGSAGVDEGGGCGVGVESKAVSGTVGGHFC